MIFFIISLLIVLADQSVKFLVSSNFSAGGQLDIIPNILRITYISNSGGAFSIFSNHTLILAIISVVACAFIIFLMIKGKMSGLGKLALCFILGGAIGNMIDRFLMGYVVDMFQPLFINFAVFNVADIFITIGAVMFVVYIIFFWRPAKSRKHKGAEPDALEDESERPDSPALYAVPVPAPAFPDNPDKKMTSKERREYKKAQKYGPDIDESTIHIPVDQIKTALGKVSEDTIVAPPVAKKPVQDYRTTPVAEAPVAKPAPAPSGEAHMYTLDEIMREYGHED